MFKKTALFILFILFASGFRLFGETLDKELQNEGFSVFKDKTSSVNFTLEDLNGKKVSLSDYKGKAVMLNFWATWCPPCRREMPSMEKLYSKINKAGFEILAVNIQEDKKTVSDFVSKNKYTFPVLLDTEAEAASIYQIRTIPTTFLVDKKGYLRAVFNGSREWDEKNILDLFKKLAAE